MTLYMAYTKDGSYKTFYSEYKDTHHLINKAQALLGEAPSKLIAWIEQGYYMTDWRVL